MAKIFCVLYEDPVTGYPGTYAREGIPDIHRYPEYLIVQGGKLAGAGAHSYGAGDALRGSEEATRFKTPSGAGQATHG